MTFSLFYGNNGTLQITLVRMKRFMYFALFVLASCAAIFLFFLLPSLLETREDKWCKEAREDITHMLRSPSSAKFPYKSCNVYYNEEWDAWRFMVMVDALNGFGAEVRENWYCVAFKNGKFMSNKEVYSVQCSDKPMKPVRYVPEK